MAKLAIVLAAAVALGNEPTPQLSENEPQTSGESLSSNSGESTSSGQVSSPVFQEARSLDVFVGKSRVVNSPEPLKRVSVTDPAIASATIITPNQVLIHGHLPGSVSLILWDELERMRTYDLQVLIDLSALQQSMESVLTNEVIEVSQSGDSIVLTGKVSSQAVAERAVALAQTYAENVVNILDEVGNQVSLKVRFAEVDRSALQELGVTLLGTGVAFDGSEAIGSVSTQQFQQVLGNVGALPANIQRGADPPAPNLVSGAVRNQVENTPAVFGLSDLANIFVFLPDRNLGFVIRALEQRNLLEILAEPNLLAQNGREASFLAGGEFPFPTVQAVTGGIPAVTIQFREFGVRLIFTPTVTSDGTISLSVEQEVSALDFSNALTIQGFVVPALSTRRAHTELQLRDGQSFAIAGLIDNRLTEVASKIPGLGDIPILGKLFQSRQMQRNNTELMVLVTPNLVQPIEAGEPLPVPAYPKPFMQNEEFDQKKDDETEGGEPPGEESGNEPAPGEAEGGGEPREVENESNDDPPKKTSPKEEPGNS